MGRRLLLCCFLAAFRPPISADMSDAPISWSLDTCRRRRRLESARFHTVGIAGTELRGRGGGGYYCQTPHHTHTQTHTHFRISFHSLPPTCKVEPIALVHRLLLSRSKPNTIAWNNMNDETEFLPFRKCRVISKFKEDSIQKEFKLCMRVLTMNHKFVLRLCPLLLQPVFLPLTAQLHLGATTQTT